MEYKLLKKIEDLKIYNIIAWGILLSLILSLINMRGFGVSFFYNCLVIFDSILLGYIFIMISLIKEVEGGTR